jgi:hypothetical protein
VVKKAGLLLGEDHHPSCLIGEALEHSVNLHGTFLFGVVSGCSVRQDRYGGVA